MATDTSNPTPGAARPDWKLPDIVDLKIRRVRFQPHEHKHLRSALPAHEAAIEFLVQLSGPIPARALGAALFIGATPVVESEPVKEHVYRFLAFNSEALKANAPIGWGWMDTPEKERRRTKFRYQPPG